jgi:hypothetical protein
MARQVAAACVLGAVVAVGVVSGQERIDRDTIQRIREEGLTRSQAMRLFDMFTTVIGPRLTASPEFKRAADWARERLAEWGLSNPRLEAWEFGRGWAVDRIAVELIEPRYLPLIAYPDGWARSTDGEVAGAPLFLGDKSLDEIAALAPRLKGAIVLTHPMVTSFIRGDRIQPTADAPSTATPSISPSQPRPGGRDEAEKLAALLRASGVAAILRPTRGEHGTVFVTGRDQGAEAMPTIVVAAEQYNMVARMLDRGVPVRMRVSLQTRYLEQDRNGYNVLAEIPGVDPARRDEIVMLGAHLDSWHTATGATDNADGSAVAMEAFRILQAIGVRPRRTLRLALWGGEEQGLHGSRRWVERHLAGEANAAAREQFSVYFNIDPGTGPIYGFFLEHNDAARPIFDAWLEPFRDLGARRNVIGRIGSTDHLSFIDAGVPGFNPVQDYVDYDVRTHHTNADTWERVREEDLKQGAVILASFLYHAAMRDSRIPRAAPPAPSR